MNVPEHTTAPEPDTVGTPLPEPVVIPPEVKSTTLLRRARRLRGAMQRYRLMAYITGTWLILLVFVGIPLQAFGHPGVEKVTGTVHGFLFIVYLLASLDLAVQARFTLQRTVLTFAGGLLPFLSFIMERRVSRELGLR